MVSSFLPQQILAQQADSTAATSQQTSELVNGDQSVYEEYFSREQQFLDERIEQYLAQMSTADKVGQLFVVSFQGEDFSLESDIAELIYLYRIGGVSISPAYSNFNNNRNNPTSTPKQVATIVNLLQSLAYGVSLGRAVALEPDVVRELGGQDWPAGILRSRAIEQGFDNVDPPNLPLFVAVEQDGNGVPGTALIHDFTQLPSQMAIGSTWDIELAEQVGNIVGRELHAVGVNMLLGPSLNVYTQPPTEQVGSLGIRSFGRSPFWVSKMSRAYIQGIHTGGEKQVITIARHFPGQGSSDRLPDQEIATIQETSEELEEIHIAPFASVTRNDSIIVNSLGDQSMTDGLMSSHMRYGSLQGGPNAKPISLVPRLSELLESEQFAAWRQRGLVMSNELGSIAIRRSYDPSMTEFPIRDVALSAFDAGHDLLYLSHFGLEDTWESEKSNIIEIITYFQQLYAENPDFAAQVDESVRRILRVKMRMYTPSPTDLLQIQLDEVTAATTGTITETNEATATNTVSITATEIGSATNITDTGLISDTNVIDIVNSYHVSLTQAIKLSDILAVSTDLDILEGPNRDEANAIVGQVAQSSFTLLYPNNVEQLPQPPEREDSILIITDSRLVKECESCLAQVVGLGPDRLKDKIVELYGPEGRALVDESQFTTIGFSDLAEYLDKSAEATAASATENGAGTATETAEAEPTEQTTTDGDNAENAAGVVDEAQALVRMEERFAESDWVIFVMIDVVEEIPSSAVVKRFLGADGERLRGGDKTVAVLALNAPYFLDATEVSQLSAYFGVNSSTDLFIENAVNGLFKAYTPRGAPVYSVPGTLYSNLSERLQPDPESVLTLQLFVDDLLVGQVPVAVEEDEAPAESITIQGGQSVRLQVGPIRDRNGHVVRDGTIVEFQALNDAGEPELSSDPIMTRNGIASHTAQFMNGGRLLISAISEPATSEQLEIFVEVPEPEIVVEESTAAPAETDSSVVITSPVPVDTVEPAATPVTPASMLPVRSPNGFTLIVALLTIAVMLSLLLILQIRVLPRQYLVQNMLWAMIVGLFAYIMYSAFLLYTGYEMSLQASLFGTAIVVFMSMLIPLLWLQLREQ